MSYQKRIKTLRCLNSLIITNIQTSRIILDNPNEYGEEMVEDAKNVIAEKREQFRKNAERICKYEKLEGEGDDCRF